MTASHERIPEVSLIIPCLNEAGNAALYEETLFRHLDAAGFEAGDFSDGGSTDGTRDNQGNSCATARVRLLQAVGDIILRRVHCRAIPACRGGYIVFS